MSGSSAEEEDCTWLRIQQLKLMEHQLAAMNWKPRDLEKRVQELEEECQKKEQTIQSLEKQLKELTLQRQQDSKIVEEKATRIKEWVANKLQELEHQNQELQIENELLQEQNEILRDRLQSLPAKTAREIYRLSLQESLSSQTARTKVEPSSKTGSRTSSFIESQPNILSCDSPPLHDIDYDISRNDSNFDSVNKSAVTDDGDQSDINLSDIETEESISDMEHDPFYQEVDQNHESTYEPCRPHPPQIKIERRVFQEVSRMDSLVSSSNGSEDMLDDRIPNSGHSPDLEGHEQSRTEEIIVEDIIPDGEVISTTPTTPLFPGAPPTTPTSLLTLNFPNNTVATFATLPRAKKDSPLQQSLKLSNSETLEVLKTVHEYQQAHCQESKSEAERVSSSVFDADSLEAPVVRARAATSPSRKVTEAVIHNTKVTGPKKHTPVDSRKLHLDKSPVTETATVDHLYTDTEVPVYATLKGKAALIRNSPFMEDSSTDSSDNEDGAVGDHSNQLEAAVSVAGPCNTKSSTIDSLRKQTTSHSTSGAVKRGVSCHSAASDVSADYAVPPDEVSLKSESENSEPEHKLLKYAAEIHARDTLEKCGYLSKLSGKVKMWKRRWFVLRNAELFYYKSQHDVLRKPQGSIKLDAKSKVIKTNGQLTFQISSAKKTYYLSADTVAAYDGWVKVVHKTLKRQATNFLLDQIESKAVIKGWLTKVRNGIARKCWCVLLGRYFLYYKTPHDGTPLGQITLRDAKLEEIDTTSDSDDEEQSKSIKHVLAVWPPFQGPTYLIIPTKQEKASWLYHLTVATGGGMGNVGSDYEQLVAKLMEVNGEQNSVFWKHPLLLHSKDPIMKSLTTLPSEELQQKALELFRAVYQFMYTTIESQSLDFHVNLAQKLLQMCFQYPDLQNELYCQLIKQTSRHPVQHKMAVQNLLLCGKHSWFLCDGSPTSPTNSIVDLSDSKQNPPIYVLVQGWQLLSMFVSLFLPKQSIMWHLKVHLHRNVDPRTEVGKYAIFCQRALERTQMNGCRESKPSRMEIMSILLRHPYHHSHPISIPVHFLNNSYQVISFDGSTTVQEFLQTLNRTIGSRECEHSGFALLTDDPGDSGAEHYLHTNLKVCDVISKWEQAYRDKHSGKLDSSRTIKFIYKNRLYFKHSSRFETDKEKLLLVYQVNEEIMQGRFPVNKDLALELSSLMSQIEFGDIKTSDSSGGTLAPPASPGSQQSAQINLALNRFYPKKYREELRDDERRVVVDRLCERWSSLRGRSYQDCVRVYLTVARKWPYCGARLFEAKLRHSNDIGDQIWLTVQEDGIAVLEHFSMQPINSYDYKSIITFGGWKNDFMLVVNQLIESAPHHYEHRTEKLLFCIARIKILEITNLMAGYINIRLQHPSPDSNNDI